MKEIKAYIHRDRVGDVISALKNSGTWGGERGDARHNLAAYLVRSVVASPSGPERHYSMDLGDEVINEYKLELICPDDEADELVKLIWSPNPQGLVLVPAFAESIEIMGQPFASYRIFLILFGAIMMTLVWWLVNKTRIGIIIRAGVQDSDMVQTLGINVRQVFTMVFAVGVGLAAMGGIATAPFNGVYPGMGGEFLLKSFIVVVIGGFGSVVGTAVSAIFLGLTEQILPWFFPKLAAVAPVAVMALVLLLKPEGLFNLSGRRSS